MEVAGRCAHVHVPVHVTCAAHGNTLYKPLIFCKGLVVRKRVCMWLVMHNLHMRGLQWNLNCSIELKLGAINYSAKIPGSTNVRLRLALLSTYSHNSTNL